MRSSQALKATSSARRGWAEAAWRRCSGVIPRSCREEVLRAANRGHPNRENMDRLTKGVWWPLMDREVQRYIQNCLYSSEKMNNSLEQLDEDEEAEEDTNSQEEDIFESDTEEEEEDTESEREDTYSDWSEEDTDSDQDTDSQEETRTEPEGGEETDRG